MRATVALLPAALATRLRTSAADRTTARARPVARWRQVRVLRVAVQQLGQHLDLRRLPRDLLGQRSELRLLRCELRVALGKLRALLGERRLEQRDARLRIGIPPVVSLVANRHTQLRSRADRRVDPSRATKCRGLNGYRSFGSLFARAYSARCRFRRLLGVVSGRATIPSPSLQGSHRRARPLPSSDFRRLRRYYGPVRLLADPIALACGLARSVAVATRVGRGLPCSARPCRGVPSLLPRRSGPERRRALLRSVLPSPTYWRLGLPDTLRGYIWVRCALQPVASQPRDCSPRRAGPASAGRLATPRRGPGYLIARLLSGQAPFILQGTAGQA